MKQWFSIQNKAESKLPAEILIYDQIGKDWFTNDGVSAKEFADALKEIPKDKEIVVGINSPGGNVWDGLAIYHQLKARGEKITTRIDGVAASIASVIALAGSKVLMPENALMMIHRAWGMAQGNAADMLKLAETLATHDGIIANIYSEKNGKTREENLKAMEVETWFNGAEARAFGLADELMPAQTISNSHDLSKFKNFAAKASAHKDDSTGNVPSIQVPDALAASSISAAPCGVVDGVASTPPENKTKKETTMSQTAPTPAEQPTPAPANNADVIAAINALGETIKNASKPAPGVEPLKAHVKKQITNGDELWKEASEIKDLAERTLFVRSEIKGKGLRFSPMNANSLGGTEITRIAQMTLDYLAVQMRPLSAFTTDFSAETAMPGKTITTRFVTQPSTADFSSSKAVADVTTTAKSITLDKYRGVSLGFTDLERTYTDVQMQDLFIRPSVTAIYEHIMASAFALVLNANYSSNVVSTAANTDADDIADYASTLSTAKCPTTGRSLILSSAYYANLAKDNAIQAAYAYGGSEAIRENQVPRVHGFDVFEYTGTIPTNSENLGSIALHKSALLIASRRVVPPQAGTWYGNVQSATDPDSGLTVDVRTHYDGTNQVLQTSLLYGVAVGHGAALVRIKTA